MEEITEDELLDKLVLEEEYVVAWIWTLEHGAYPLGPMKDGLGWVSEENITVMAEQRQDRIFFLQWSTRSEYDARHAVPWAER